MAISSPVSSKEIPNRVADAFHGLGSDGVLLAKDFGGFSAHNSAGSPKADMSRLMTPQQGG